MNDDALASDLSMAVVRLARYLRLHRQAQTLTLSQFSAMTTLHRDGPMTAGTLAARERVSPPSMTRVVETLAEMGRITRTPHPTDGRMTIVELTPVGVDTVTSAAAEREQWLHHKLDQLPPDHYSTLVDAARIIETILTASDYHD